MAKKGKVKISKTKRNNQTTNKMRKAGKLKLQRHKPRVQKQHVQTKSQQPEYSSESEASGDEWADMLDEEEQKYIMTRIAKQPQLLSNVPEKDPTENKRGTKRKKERMPKPVSRASDSGAETDSDSNSEMEEKYEKEIADRPAKKMRPLLPIKTKEGILERAEECEETESEPEEETKPQATEKPKDKDDPASDSEADSGLEGTAEEGEAPEGVITTVDLMAARRDKLNSDKLRIGALCSSLLECPEKKLKNLYPVLYLMEPRQRDGAAGLPSVRKLAALSAAEVFRDILPDYCIRHQDYSNVKLKKETLALYKYEKELLEMYRRYLQRLEKGFAPLRQRKGDGRPLDDATKSLSLVFLKCMVSLLVARPQFNYSSNIAQSVVPLLACRVPAARDLVTRGLVDVFAEDRKGEITLTIVRLINQLARKRGARLPPAALDCLLTLDIGDVDLDRDADLQHKKRQEEKHRKRIVNLSKKEKKRAKKLKEVERELLETEAQESAAARKKLLTEVTKTVFNVYFRLLKAAGGTPLWPAALHGIAKFTHVINLEYYSDLVAILSRALRDDDLTARARLQCVRAVLAVLASADGLNVDPARFHAQLYADALSVHAGATHTDAPLVLEAAAQVVARARRVSAAVLAALAKRLATLAAQLLPHGALAALALVHQLAQHKPVGALLEPDDSGSGRFDPQSPSPEHCGAQAAALYELCALRRQHHPAARAAAAALLANTWPPELAKLSPMKIYEQYDGSQMSFKPAVPPPPPRKPTPSAKPVHAWAQDDFRKHCETVADSVQMQFSEAIVR